jgi:hypothetical protein
VLLPPLFEIFALLMSLKNEVFEKCATDRLTSAGCSQNARQEPFQYRSSATIKGFGAMWMIRSRQCLMLEPGVAGEVRFVNRLLRLAA